MPTVIDCPFCHRGLTLPEEALSRHVQCPRCGGNFLAARSRPADEQANDPVPRVILEVEEVAPPIPGVPPPPRPLVPVLLSSNKESGSELPAPALERCPRCAARISRALERCLSCGEKLRPGDDERPWERSGAPPRRDCEPHRGPLILALGRISLCFAVPGLLGVAYLPFAIASLIGAGLGLTVTLMARDDLAQMDRKEMDPDGHQSTQAGQTASSIGLIIGIVGLLLAGLLRLPQLFAGGP
jgi:hypothetical protein